MVSPGRVAFTVFGLDVMWYGLLIGMAFLICGAIAMKRTPKHGVDPDHFLDVLLWTVPAAIVGARAYYVIFSWDQYKDNLKSIFDTRSGGLAIHGGLILCFLVAYIVSKRRNEKPLSVFDLASVCIPLGQAIGRWGNFFNSEAHGGPTDLPWAQIIDGVGYHPAPTSHGRKHIGIANAQTRLALLCGGTLTLNALPERGPVCEIRIPKGGNEE